MGIKEAGLGSGKNGPYPTSDYYGANTIESEHHQQTDAETHVPSHSTRQPYSSTYRTTIRAKGCDTII